MPRTPDSADTARGVLRRARLDYIEGLLLDDMPAREIIKEIAGNPRWLNEQGQPLHERTVYRNIHEVWHRIRARYDAERDVLHAKARAKWERRERLADKAGDLKAANAALDAWTKLHGLYAPKKAELEVKGAVRVDVNVQVRGIVGVLSARGLEALRVLHEEIEAARVAGRLPAAAAAPTGEPEEDEDEPAPVPADGSVN